MELIDSFDALEILIILGILGVLILIQILYILTLRNTLRAITPQNRTMKPENTWLLLIPFFNIVWAFIVVNNLSSSIYNESKVKEFTLHEAKPANGVGIAMCILRCFSFLGGIAGLPAIICWIIYWNKISNYKTAIIQAAPKPAGGDSLIF